MGSRKLKAQSRFLEKIKKKIQLLNSSSTPMEWVRGETIGHGSFGMVSLAKPKNQSSETPSLMAVKSCPVSHSASLLNEKQVLDELEDCQEVIGCFGDSFTVENGERLYNLALEYAAGGDLADKVKGNLPEPEIRFYTNSILRGLQFIHGKGFVHCDIKLQNILLSDAGLKIADFGLAKKAGVKEIRGTPMYMSPEMVVGGEQEAPADIWALGCVVVEMASGAPAWRCRREGDFGGLLMRIGVGEEVPEIPGTLSEEGKDFLGKCFLKDPKRRWTAQMLLSHPFVTGIIDHRRNADNGCTVSSPLSKDEKELPKVSPRNPFDFPDWESDRSCSIISLPWPEYSAESNLSESLASRLRQLVTDQRPDWSTNSSSSWISVR